MPRIGIIIEQLRKERNWTQKDLEKRSGITYVTISEIESGKTAVPKMQTLQKLASAFKMDLTELWDYGKNNEDTDISNTSTETGAELIAWALCPNNQPYLEFAFKLSKKIPVNLLDSLKFFIDINNGGLKNE